MKNEIIWKTIQVVNNFTICFLLLIILYNDYQRFKIIKNIIENNEIDKLCIDKLSEELNKLNNRIEKLENIHGQSN